MQIIRRISKIMSLLIVYVMIAWGYMTTKGFVIKDGTPVLSNVAQASSEKQEFATKISGDIMLSHDRERILGNKDAPISIYVFSAATCSHCREYHKFTLPKLERDFVSKGIVKIIYVHLPMDVTSMRVAKLSYCIPSDNFYNFIDELYGERDWIFARNDNVLNKYAQKYGLNEEGIRKCSDNKKLTSDILLTRDNAVNNLGVKGTPSFIVKNNKEAYLLSPHKYSKLKEFLENMNGDIINEKSAK